MKKVLVAVDGSEHSRKAFEYSLKGAKGLDRHLTILRVVSGLGYAGDVIEKVLEEEIKNAEEFTEELKSQAEEEGIDVDARVKTGTNVATEIVKFAVEEDYDLIVVGSRGKTDLETVTLGSVSESVIRRAHCPVLVVR